MELRLTYQDFRNFEYYCQKNGITILSRNFNQEICYKIEITMQEKEKILSEIEKQYLNIQYMEIKKEKYIKRNYGKIK